MKFETPISLLVRTIIFSSLCIVALYPEILTFWKLSDLLWRKIHSQEKNPRLLHRHLLRMRKAQFPISRYLPFSIFSFFYLPFRNTPFTFLVYPRFSPCFTRPLLWQDFEPGTLRWLRARVPDRLNHPSNELSRLSTYMCLILLYWIHTCKFYIHVPNSTPLYSVRVSSKYTCGLHCVSPTRVLIYLLTCAPTIRCATSPATLSDLTCR